MSTELLRKHQNWKTGNGEMAAQGMARESRFASMSVSTSVSLSVSMSASVFPSLPVSDAPSVSVSALSVSDGVPNEVRHPDIKDNIPDGVTAGTPVELTLDTVGASAVTLDGAPMILVLDPNTTRENSWTFNHPVEETSMKLPVTLTPPERPPSRQRRTGSASGRHATRSTAAIRDSEAPCGCRTPGGRSAATSPVTVIWGPLFVEAD